MADNVILDHIEKIHASVREVWVAGYSAGYDRRVRETDFAAKVAPDKEHAAPTYISGSSDRVYLISEMPTRYIRNVLAMPATRQTKGLVDSLRGELRSRGESSYKAYDR